MCTFSTTCRTSRMYAIAHVWAVISITYSVGLIMNNDSLWCTGSYMRIKMSLESVESGCPGRQVKQLNRSMDCVHRMDTKFVVCNVQHAGHLCIHDARRCRSTSWYASTYNEATELALWLANWQLCSCN